MPPLNSTCYAEQAESLHRMPQRTLVLFNIGPPFGGFRLAVNPHLFGASGSTAFPALERVIQNLQSVLAAHPPDTWSRLVESEGMIGDPAELFGGRPGRVDFTCDPASTTGDVVVRAFLRFRLWPLGGWAVYDAWHREADGRWVGFAEEELAEVW